MDGSRARLDTLSLAKVPTLAKRRLERPSQDGMLKTSWALALGLGWPVAFEIATRLEPTPAHPHGDTPLIVTLGANVFVVAMIVTVAASVMRHGGAGIAGVIAGGIAFGFAVACPVSGHHALGLWWFGQLALIGVMLAVSIAALGARSRSVT